MSTNRMVSSLSIIVSALMLALSGAAAAATGGGLDERVTLDFKEAHLQEVLGAYEHILGAELHIDSTIDRRITISFDNITVRTSLDAICESAGCRWELIDGDPLLLRIDRDDEAAGLSDVSLEGGDSRLEPLNSRAKRAGSYDIHSTVALELTDAEVTSVLETVARIIGSRLLMDTRFAEEKITVNVSGMPIATLLDTICSDLACAWKLTDADPRTLEVYFP